MFDFLLRIFLRAVNGYAFDEEIGRVNTSFVSALQHSVPQLAEFAIQKMTAL